MDGVAACAGAPAATDARKIKKAITVFLMSAKLMIFPNSAIKTKENPKCNDRSIILFYKFSSSVIQRRTLASDGMRKSPRGEKLTGLILGPSGMQERLNC